jgi:hypothetical protein
VCRSVETCYNCWDVRVRLKYALPLAQMALAAALLWQFRREVGQPPKSGYPLPALDLLLLINPPLAILSRVWVSYVGTLWSDATQVALVGAFWWLVGLILDSWQRIFLLTRKPLRVAADLALIVLGPYFVWFVGRVDVAHMPLQWQAPALASVFCWLLGPAFIFGRDLIRCIRRKGAPPASPAMKC